MTAIPDSSWLVIKKYFDGVFGEETDEEVRRRLERGYEVTVFPGGVFVASGPHFDLFVDEDKRGQWNSAVVLTEYLQGLVQRYGKAVAVIREDNIPCLKLAMKFGLEIIGRDEDGDLILEKTS